MKIRKTIALLTALAMIAALVPAMALTAFADNAADVGYVVMDDGVTAYKISGKNLLGDGSFESDKWASQLTVGKSHGNDGINDISNMADNIDVWGRVAPAAGAYDGQYALRLISDSVGGTKINDPNKAASIKHYIHNDGNADQLYYVSFYAKASSTSSSLAFSLTNAGADDSSASGTDVIVPSTDWTHVEGVVSVSKGKYLLINVYNMSRETLIDDFAVYKVYEDAETKALAKALDRWNFNHANGEIISADLRLPTTSGGAKVTWVSDNPGVISETGDYIAPAEDTPVTLTATITSGPFSVEKVYHFIAKGIGDDVRAKVAATLPYVVTEDVKLITTVDGYKGSSVTWTSSKPSVIRITTGWGRYTAPKKQSTLTLTAVVSYEGSEIVCENDVIVGTHFSLIPNGTFDVTQEVDGKTQIYGWTVGVNGVDRRTGGTAPMTTDTYKLEQETLPDGTVNNYIVSTGHKGLDDPNSIRTYVDLEPGQIYELSYKIRYMGDGQSDECYIGAYLVDRGGAEIIYNSYTDFEAKDGSTLGGTYYMESGYWQSGHRLTAADGWQTVTAILRPTTARSTLLIAGKWMNRQENGHSDGRWALDDFVLEKYNVAFYGDVVINYIDVDTGEILKDTRVVERQPGDVEYIAEDSDKADITIGRDVYRYVPTSVDRVMVQYPQDSDQLNEINLYFRRLEAVEVTVRFINGDYDEGEELKDEETFIGYVGFEATAPSSMLEPIFLSDGTFYAYSRGNNPIVVSIDEEKNIITLYFKKSKNLIYNGDFATGDTSGWTNRRSEDNTAITGATVAFDSQIGGNALTIVTQGRESTQSIGTTWTVQVGKTYKLSFWVGGTKPEANNNQYNQVTDSRAHSNSQIAWDCAGNVLLPFGERMVDGQWTYMETEFTAQTNMVYFESSWAKDAMSFADFHLEEIKNDFTADVTVNYIDRDTGITLKESRVQSNVAGAYDGSNVYTATDDDKSAIVVNESRYVYDSSSNDSVVITTGYNVINLYFNLDTPVSIEEVIIDIVSGSTPELPKTVLLTYSDGATMEASVTWGGISDLPEGYTAEVYGTTAGGLQVVATINVFYAGSSNPDDFDWVGTGDNRVAIEKGAKNMITNGDLASGTTSGFTRASDGGTLEWEVVENTEYSATGKAMHFTGAATGGGGANTMRTFYPVEPGKTYYGSFEVYNASGAPTEAQKSTGMVALVATEGKGFGDAQASGAKLYSHVDNGGINSWSPGGSSNTDFPIIGTTTSRNDGVYQVGTNHIETVIRVPASATNPYIMISLGAWSIDSLYYSDFKLYEVQVFNDMMSRVDIVLNGVSAGSVMVPKGEDAQAVLAAMDEYAGCIIDASAVDTNRPNAGTAYITNPSTAATITISGNAAVVKAADAGVKGVLVVAQYNANGAMVSVVTKDIDVAAGGSESLEFTPAAGAVSVKAMAVDSLDSIVPLLRSASAKL